MIKKFTILLLLSVLFANALFASGKKKSDTVEYSIDTTLSRLFWSCNIHHGYLYIKKGCVKMAGNQLVAADVLFQMDSVFDQDITYDLMKKTLENVLRSNVFFNTKEYPYSRFLLDTAKPLGNDEFEITGDLELLGVANCITFHVKIVREGEKLEIKTGKFYINRLRWGITSYSKHAAISQKNFIVSDSIGIAFDLKAFKKASGK